MTSGKALEWILHCLDEDRVIIKAHFTKRMHEHGMFWTDVLAILESPESMRHDGTDRWDRERWLIAGLAPDGLVVELLCVIDATDSQAVFVTIYWKT